MSQCLRPTARGRRSCGGCRRPDDLPSLAAARPRLGVADFVVRDFHPQLEVGRAQLVVGDPHGDFDALVGEFDFFLNPDYVHNARHHLVEVRHRFADDARRALGHRRQHFLYQLELLAQLGALLLFFQVPRQRLCVSAQRQLDFTPDFGDVGDRLFRLRRKGNVGRGDMHQD